MEAARYGRHALARRLLHRALDAAQDADLRRQIQASFVVVWIAQGDSQKALRMCEQLLADEQTSVMTRALVLGQLALVQMQSGKSLEAIDAASAAVGVPLDPIRLANIYMTRGVAYLNLRRYASAEQDFLQAHRLFVEADDLPQAARALHNQGYVAGQLGNLPQALRLMQEARPLFLGAPVLVAVSDQDRAEVLLQAGRPREASELLAQAARVFGLRRIWYPQATAELVQAQALLPLDPQGALRVARQAVRHFRDHESVTWMLRAQVVVAQAEAEVRRLGPKALARLDALTAALRAESMAEDATVVALTTVRVLGQRGVVAQAQSRLAAVRLPRNASVLTRLLSAQVRAETFLAAGDDRKALQACRRAMDLLREWERRFAAPDLQGGLAMHTRKVIAMGLDLAVSTGRPAVMLEWSERVRSAAWMVATPQPVVAPSAASSLEQLRDLGSGQSSRHVELARDVRDAWWASASAPNAVAQRVDLETLREALGRTESTLIAYLVTSSGLHGLVVDATQEFAVRLGGAELDPEYFARLQADMEVAASIRDERIAPVLRATLHQHLERASQVLVAPLIDRISTRRVVLAVPGRLAGVPWTMLPGLVGRSVTVPPSATRWVSQVAAQWPAPRRVVLVSGPGVPRGDEEVHTIGASVAGATILTGAQAQVAHVAAAATSADLLHLVGHGHHVTENPLFSHLDLVDGPWWGYDVSRLEHVPDLVVLSACDLGQGAVMWGDESLGMARAWLHAGARAVIAAPALVNDDDACLLLPAVHSHLMEGVGPAEALSLATEQCGVLTPFVCYGSGW